MSPIRRRQRLDDVIVATVCCVLLLQAVTLVSASGPQSPFNRLSVSSDRDVVGSERHSWLTIKRNDVSVDDEHENTASIAVSSSRRHHIVNNTDRRSSRLDSVVDETRFRTLPHAGTPVIVVNAPSTSAAPNVVDGRLTANDSSSSSSSIYETSRGPTADAAALLMNAAAETGDDAAVALSRRSIHQPAPAGRSMPTDNPDFSSSSSSSAVTATDAVDIRLSGTTRGSSQTSLLRKLIVMSGADQSKTIPLSLFSMRLKCSVISSTVNDCGVSTDRAAKRRRQTRLVLFRHPTDRHRRRFRRHPSVSGKADRKLSTSSPDDTVTVDVDEDDDTSDKSSSAEFDKPKRRHIDNPPAATDDDDQYEWRGDDDAAAASSMDMWDVPQQDAAAAVDAPVGLSYRSRGVPAAGSAALIDPMNSRQRMGGNRPWMTTSDVIAAQQTTMTTSDSHPRDVTTDQYVATENDENVTSFFEFSATESDVTTTTAEYVSASTSLDANTTTDSGDDIALEEMSTAAMSVLGLDVEEKINCGRADGFGWRSVAAVSQRHEQSVSPHRHQQSVTAIVCIYTIGLLFSTTALWSTVNALSLMTSSVCRQHPVSAGNDTVDAPRRWGRSRRCGFGRFWSTLHAQLLIDGAVVVVSVSRAAWYLIGSSAVLPFDRWPTCFRLLAAVDVLFEMSWPCLTATSAVYLFDLLVSCRHRDSSTSKVDRCSSSLSSESAAAQRRCSTVLAVVFACYLLLAASLCAVVQLCIVDVSWTALHRAAFVVSVTVTLSTACCCCRRIKSTCAVPTGQRHDIGDKSIDVGEVGRRTLVVGLVSALLAVSVALDAAFVVSSPVVMATLSASARWWIGLSLQSTARLGELLLCALFCLSSSSSAVRSAELRLEHRHRVRPAASMTSRDGGCPNGARTPDNLSTVGVDTFYRLSSHGAMMPATFAHDVVGSRCAPENKSRFDACFPTLTAAPTTTPRRCHDAPSFNGWTAVSPTAANRSRSRSMLYNDNGFIRFRLDCDPEVDSDARTLDDDDDGGDPDAAAGRCRSGIVSVDATPRSGRRRASCDGGNICPNATSLSSSSLFSFRAPCVDLQDSVERELDRCELWRTAARRYDNELPQQHEDHPEYIDDKRMF